MILKLTPYDRNNIVSEGFIRLLPNILVCFES